MTTTINIGTMIVSTPGTCGGRPRIAGTRMSVQNIAIDYRAGMSPEKIVEEFPHLTLAQVYAALAYYHANKDRIEADIVKYYSECDRLSSEWKAEKL
ncbi:MAG: DUF433 domain-containing protein [Hormoscilla sp. SP5CHS1]|nr:DUF433 domain-containing protein [Hormoscilla sp. SP12CHS1]MBC6455904.1 DUF433 domain-containing protein [Hormoscilla sp. SP5CHS1]